MNARETEAEAEAGDHCTLWNKCSTWRANQVFVAICSERRR